MLTAYSFWQARLVEEAGADMILVGDSLGMVEQGFSGTLPVTLEMMILACPGGDPGGLQALYRGRFTLSLLRNPARPKLSATPAE